MLLLAAACGGPSAPTGPSGAGGTIQASVVSSGVAVANAYAISIDGAAPVPVSSGGTLTLSSVAAGTRSVRLTGVATECVVVEDNPRSVQVTAGASVSIAFHVLCSGFGYTRLVRVSTAAQLTSATGAAQAGDLILLADGRYVGPFADSASGTPDHPIIIIGTLQAILDGGSMDSLAAIRLSGNYTVLLGLSVTHGQRGVEIRGGFGNILSDLEVFGVGQEGIHVREFSKHNTIQRSRVHDTGLRDPGFGEGIYVGTTNTQWCQFSECKPDRSDSNTIRDNQLGPNVGAQLVDIKEGTVGTVLSGNTLDGHGSTPAQESWVNVYGNGVMVTGNHGSVARVNGYKIESLRNGWGLHNTFQGNVSDLGGASGFGFNVGAAPAASTVVRCDNQVTDADGGYATIPCTP